MGVAIRSGIPFHLSLPPLFYDILGNAPNTPQQIQQSLANNIGSPKSSTRFDPLFNENTTPLCTSSISSESANNAAIIIETMALSIRYHSYVLLP